MALTETQDEDRAIAMAAAAVRRGRLQIRVPRHWWIAASGWTSRIVMAGVQLIAIRELIQLLGIERYSVVALLAGLVGWYQLFDLGIGFCVQNQISEARAHGHHADLLIANSRRLCLLLLVLAIGLLWLLAPLLAPPLLRSFTTLSDAEKTLLFFVSAALSTTAALSAVVYRVWYAEHRGYLANSIPAVASLVALLLVTGLRWLPPEAFLVGSVVALLGPPGLLPLGLLLAQVAFAPSPRTPAKPVSANSDVHARRPSVRRALGFWAFAILGALILQFDYIAISQFLSGPDIATYTLVSKIFGLSYYVYGALLSALWPVFAELVAQRRLNELKSTLKRNVASGLAFMLACTVFLIWAMPAATALLAPHAGVVVSTTLVIVFGLYQMVRVWTDTFTTLLQSMAWLRPFWLFAPIQACISLSLQWVLAPRYGLVGVVTGLTLSFLVTVSWGLPVAARRHLRQRSLPGHEPAGKHP